MSATITTARRAGLEPRWKVETGEGLGGPAAAAVLLPEDGVEPLKPGQSFHELLEARWMRQGRRSAERAVALDFGTYSYSFAELIDRSHRLATYLQGAGVGRGDAVGMLLERSLDLYAVPLALSRLGAILVPMDAGFPTDRIAFILADSGARLLITTSKAGVPDTPTVLALDERHRDIEALGVDGRLPGPESSAAAAYVIYTSGTTGQPKGVVVTHANICNFINVAASCYGYDESDRVYQGLSPAFDFFVEESWVPLAAGATLVPAPQGSPLIGVELHEFITERNISALCCVPTLLATLPGTLPGLRFLLVSGEACPPDVVEPWLASGRRVLNAYGPTETTVTATWCVLAPEQAITIGGPLPTYAVVIADPEDPRGLAGGEIGEICIGGPGVAQGYLNRPELTEGSFVADFAGVPGVGEGRLYRTGDLGRINEHHQIEFLGRIDTQVKVNGYRIELGEIESALRGHAAVAQAAVQPYTPVGAAAPVLVAYLVPEAGLDLDIAGLDSDLRQALPTYMVPTYYEALQALPTLPNSKIDRDSLPVPRTSPWVSSRAPFVAPETSTEGALARLLCELLGLTEASSTADFFDDLGANSLSMAAYVTQIRKAFTVRRLSMKLIYQNSSITALAARIDELAQATAAPAPVETVVPEVAAPVDVPLDPAVAVAPSALPPAQALPSSGIRRVGVSRLRHACFGAAQAGLMMLSVFGGVLATLMLYRWVSEADGAGATYLRSAVAGSAAFFGTGVGLVALKWLVIGRFDADPIPLWGLRHLRFWVVRLAILGNPFNLFRGTPTYNVFLKLLGVRVGRGAVILSPPPTCTDLVTIGGDTVIRATAQFPGYKARIGAIHPGPIRIGSRTVVAEGTYLDIDTRIGDSAQLGTTSALLEGQRIPVGAIYQGSPAEPNESNFCTVLPRRLSSTRRVSFSVANLLWTMLVSLPIPFVLTAMVVPWLDGFGSRGASGATSWWGTATWLGVVAAVGYFGTLVVALLIVVCVPRLLRRFVVTEQVHPLYGPQHVLATSIARISNNKLLNTIFGDSSMILGYLRWVGYDLSATTQTGSNFGVDQQHHDPFLCLFQRNTLVSDGLRMLNTETSASSFITQQVVMPPDTYLGNDVFYPANAAMGDNCLIATKAAIPIQGAPRANVGILGSPPFEIPRSVKRDQQFDHFKQPGVIEGRLRLKLRSNLVTLGLYFLRSWLIAWVALGISAVALAWRASTGLVDTAAALALASILSLLAATTLSILAERLVRGFRPLEPQFCSLYERTFWDHERFWKLNYNAFLQLFDGTTLKPFFLRLQGARIGTQLFDDGSGFTEPSMVEVGDHCVLNFGSAIQSHSLEDGTFKSDRIRIGDRCTVGSMALVHYGAVVHDDGVIEPDAFVMKGSEVEANSRWLGNPARNATLVAGTDTESATP